VCVKLAAAYIVHIIQYTRDKARTLHCKEDPRPTVQVPRSTTYHTVKIKPHSEHNTKLTVQPHPTVNRENEHTAIRDTAQGHSISEHRHAYGPTPTRGQARQEHVSTKSLGKSIGASCLHFHNTEVSSHA